MRVGIEVFALLGLAWLMVDLVLVGAALLGARAHDRRTARQVDPPPFVASIATLRAAGAHRRSWRNRRM
ncbi:MAG TPA: hypothetical protein VEX39_18190 [Thermoleophilaceae bacterium]|nr:hypothetical protein [Thermoleophilaceae bacterium]